MKMTEFHAGIPVANPDHLSGECVVQTDPRKLLYTGDMVMESAGLLRVDYWYCEVTVSIVEHVSHE